MKNSPGLGYVLGDDGSGAYLGRKVIQYFLYNTFDPDLADRFKAKFNTSPYWALDYKGCRFVHLNNFLGSTQDNKAVEFNPSLGSLGEEQLHWFEAQLAERKPTFVFVHYPLLSIKDVEFRDYGLHTLLRKYQLPQSSWLSGAPQDDGKALPDKFFLLPGGFFSKVYQHFCSFLV